MLQFSLQRALMTISLNVPGVRDDCLTSSMMEESEEGASQLQPLESTAAEADHFVAEASKSLVVNLSFCFKHQIARAAGGWRRGVKLYWVQELRSFICDHNSNLWSWGGNLALQNFAKGVASVCKKLGVQ